jgi:PAS domain S-box-containing protein
MKQQTEQAGTSSLMNAEVFRYIVENANTPVIIAQDLAIKIVNSAAEDLTGYPRKELLDGLFTKFVHPDDRHLLSSRHEKRICGECVPESYEFKIVTLQGQSRWVEIKATRISWDNRPASLCFLTDITSRKQAQQDLHASLELLRDIVEFLPDPTFVVDKNRKVIAWNRACEEVFNVKKESMVGQGDYAYAIPVYHKRRPILVDLIFSPDDEIMSGYDHAWAEGDKLLAEGFVPHLNHGSGKYLWCIASPLYDQEGLRIGAIETIRDITERKKAEVSLRESEEKFRTLIEQSVNGLVLIDERELICEWNTAMERITEYSRPEVIGKPYLEVAMKLMPSERRTSERIEQLQAVHRRFRCAGREAGKSVVDVGIVTKSGIQRIIQQVTFSIETSKGGRVGMIIRDITDAKKNELALKESVERFRLIAENVNEGFWVIALASRRCLYSNPALDSIFGEPLKGKTSREVIKYIHPHDREIVLADQAYAKNTEIEFRIVRPDGEIRWIRLRGFITTDPFCVDGLLLGVTTDITMAKKAAIEAEERRQQLIQAEKMATLGVLVSGVAHEINNPNNYLMLNAKILNHAWHDALPVLEKHFRQNPDFKLADLGYAEARTLLPDILLGLSDGTQRIKRIVDNLRNYARKDASDMNQAVDLNKTAESTLVLLSNMIRKATDNFQTHFAQSLPCIRGNIQQIEQVIINLISNACQALGDRSQRIDLYTFEQNAIVVLKVVDTGCGIPRESLNKILDPFFTTKRESGGTGLGLSISMNIIHNHGGSIEFASEVGKGTTVTLRFPAMQSNESYRKTES